MYIQQVWLKKMLEIFLTINQLSSRHHNLDLTGIEDNQFPCTNNVPPAIWYLNNLGCEVLVSSHIWMDMLKQ